MNVPYKFVYIWRNGDIAHIIANTQLEASLYVQHTMHKFVDFAYVIKRRAMRKDFHDTNSYLIGDVNECDVIMESLSNLTETYYPTVRSVFSRNLKKQKLSSGKEPA